MSPDPYSSRVRALFAAPAHAGTARGATTVRLDEQGLRLELSARLAGEVVEELRFRAWGCPHVIAAAEALCAACEGRGLAALENVSAAELMQSLPVPTEKTGRILVIEDTVCALVEALLNSTAIRAEND